MRQIVLDTETTGLRHQDGHRVIELGCVEMVNRELTGNNLHLYFNPERDSDPDALKVHGLTTEFLAEHNRFADEAHRIIDYLRGAELIIHNAEFDMGFLNAEFKRAHLPALDTEVGNVIDTLLLAREMFPGQRNNLDALCSRYSISNLHRVLHGALLDSELLAGVYIAMTRGQFGLNIDINSTDNEQSKQERQADKALYASLPVWRATQQEQENHREYLQALAQESGAPSLWESIDSQA